MSERREYELSEEEYQRLLEAGKPVPFLIIGGVAPLSPQQHVNSAWQWLGAERGFDWTTVKAGRDEHHFTAVPRPVREAPEWTI